jgi:hypothetical protein
MYIKKKHTTDINVRAIQDSTISAIQVVILLELTLSRRMTYKDIAQRAL